MTIRQTDKHVPYQMFNQVPIPTELLRQEHGLTYGGDIRIGDLQQKGTMDFLVYRSAALMEGGAAHPIFLAAFTMKGEILWKNGQGRYSTQPTWPRSDT